MVLVIELKESKSVYHLPKKSGNFGWNVNGKTILVRRPENFRNKRNVFRGTPKFPTGISKRKIVFHLLFSTSSKTYANCQTSSRLYVN